MSRCNAKSGHASRGKLSKESRNRVQAREVGGRSDSGYQPVDVPLHLQQKALDVFRDSLNPTSDDRDLIQEVKGHLFDRNFTVAFGRAEYLRVYAARWSPSRALGYLQVFSDVQDRLFRNFFSSDGNRSKKLKVVSIGGGAGAELVGLGAWLHSLSSNAEDRIDVDACFVDIARWNEILDRLYESLVTPPILSKYASAAAKEHNTAMLSKDVLSIQVAQEDMLTSDDSLVQEVCNADLVTIMFTLNELYSTSVPKTQQMLARLTSQLKPGSHLLVVDSPGSYSTVTINGSEKKYPMQWLLSHTLLGSTSRNGNYSTEAMWENVVEDESRWFRVSPKLAYPIDLENMRYQIHLYRRLAFDAGAESG